MTNNAGQHILAVITEDFSNLSSAYQPDEPNSPAEEYVSGIDLDTEVRPFQEKLKQYGNVPVSTFSILA